MLPQAVYDTPLPMLPQGRLRKLEGLPQPSLNDVILKPQENNDTCPVQTEVNKLPGTHSKELGSETLSV